MTERPAGTRHPSELSLKRPCVFLRASYAHAAEPERIEFHTVLLQPCCTCSSGATAANFCSRATAFWRSRQQQLDKPAATLAVGAASAAEASVAASTFAGSASGAFVPSATFDGPKAGYVFRSGDEGLGYYKDLTAKDKKKNSKKKSASGKQDGAADGNVSGALQPPSVVATSLLLVAGRSAVRVRAVPAAAKAVMVALPSRYRPSTLW